jgi:hypothetical protein
MSFFETKEFWSALIQGLCTLAAAGVVYALGRAYIEKGQLRHLRVEQYVTLVSYRYAIAEGVSPSAEASDRLIAALNAIPALYGDQKEILLLARKVRESGAQGEDFVALIRAISEIVRVAGTTITDFDLGRPVVRSPSAPKVRR